MMNNELTINEIRSRSLKMLKYVDAVCKEKNITYFLAAGTLLGAVRHKGFIPWDDDIDIMLPREDYERLIKEFPNNSRYDFLTFHNTTNFPFAYGKVIDKNTIKIEPLRSKYQFTGVDIDVFPIDNYPEDLEESKVWCEEIRRCHRKILGICTTYVKGGSFYSSILKNFIILYKHFLDDIGLRTAQKYVKILDKLAQQNNSATSPFCGIAAISAYGIKKRNRSIVYSKTIELEFEGYYFPAPIGYDEYLKDYYGDYMLLPPVEQRISHHTYKAYSR